MRGSFELLRNRNACGLQCSGLRKAWLDCPKGTERADHEHRAHDEHERKRYLPHDEQVLGAMLRPPLHPAAAAGTQRRADLRTCVAQRGNGPEQHARHRRDEEREQERPPVECDRVDARQTRGREPFDQRERSGREAEPKRAAGDADECALYQQRAHDAPGARAEGAADRELGSALLRAYE